MPTTIKKEQQIEILGDRVRITNHRLKALNSGEPHVSEITVQEYERMQDPEYQAELRKRIFDLSATENPISSIHSSQNKE